MWWCQCLALQTCLCTEELIHHPPPKMVLYPWRPQAHQVCHAPWCIDLLELNVWYVALCTSISNCFVDDHLQSWPWSLAIWTELGRMENCISAMWYIKVSMSLSPPICSMPHHLFHEGLQGHDNVFLTGKAKHQQHHPSDGLSWPATHNKCLQYEVLQVDQGLHHLWQENTQLVLWYDWPVEDLLHCNGSVGLVYPHALLYSQSFYSVTSLPYVLHFASSPYMIYTSWFQCCLFLFDYTIVELYEYAY